MKTENERAKSQVEEIAEALSQLWKEKFKS